MRFSLVAVVYVIIGKGTNICMEQMKMKLHTFFVVFNTRVEQLIMVINILFLSGLHVNATLILNTCTSWHETMLVSILLNQK